MHAKGTATALRRTRSGFALMELVVAIALMAIAFAGISSTLATTMSQRKANQESARAIRAALSMADTLRDADFATLFASYNASDLDDPNGVGTAPGSDFAIPGLTAREDDADGFVGRVVFPGDGLTLREDTVETSLGLPRDLNGDLVVDALDHAADYEVLPLTIQVDWAGPRGPQSIQIATTMTSR